MMRLEASCEIWDEHWRTVASPEQGERPLMRLRWLEEFALDSGPALPSEQFRMLQQQIEIGEKKLVEMHGDFETQTQPVSAIPRCGMHAFRHAHATLSLASNPNAKPTLSTENLVGAVEIEHDARTTKSRGMTALKPPSQSNC